jgi:hypothetical protein
MSEAQQHLFVFDALKTALSNAAFKNEVTLKSVPTGRRWYVRNGTSFEDRFTPRRHDINQLFIDKRLCRSQNTIKFTVAIKSPSNLYDASVMDLVTLVKSAFVDSVLAHNPSNDRLFTWLFVGFTTRDGKWQQGAWYDHVDNTWSSDSFNTLDIQDESAFMSHLSLHTFGATYYLKGEAWDRHAIGLAEQYISHGIMCNI